jgi:hypothetical protein
LARAPRFLLVLALLAAFGVAVLSEFPLCPMAGTFGVPCPGCGLTRATLALFRGDLRAALHFHPLVLLLTPLFVSFMGVALWELLRAPPHDAPTPSAETSAGGRRIRFRASARQLNVAGAALLVLVLGVWLLRFAGYFGGPVPVTTVESWLTSFKR